MEVPSPEGSEYEESATDFIWCPRSKYIDFSSRILNCSKIICRYILYIRKARRSKSWRFSASFTDFLTILAYVMRALHRCAYI